MDSNRISLACLWPSNKQPAAAGAVETGIPIIRKAFGFSLLIRPKQMSAEHFSCMTLFAGLCVAEALNDLGINTGIKWPNDLIAIASGRKLVAS